MPENQFIIDLITRFSSQGLGEIAKEAQQELARLAQTPTAAPTSPVPSPAGRGIEGSVANLVKSGGGDFAQFQQAMAALASRVTAGSVQGPTSLAEVLKPQTLASLAALNPSVANVAGPKSSLDGQAQEVAQRRKEATQLSNKVRELLNADSEYIGEMVRESRLRKEQSGLISEQKAADRDYIAQTVLTANARRQERIAENKALLADPNAARLAGADRLNAARVQTAGNIETSKQTTQADINQRAEENQLKAAITRRTRIEELAIASTNAVVREQAELNQATRALARKQATADLAASRPDINADAALKVAQERRAAQQSAAEASLNDPSTTGGARSAQLQARTAVLEQARAAYIEQATTQGLVADNKYIDATAAAANAQEEKALKIRASQLGVSRVDKNGNELPIEDLRAATAQAERTRANQRATAAAKTVSDADIQSSVERRAAEVRLRRAVTIREKAYIEDAIQAGEISKGTRFQRLQSALSPNAQVPEDFRTLGQFVGQKTVQTIGYGIGGAALFGGVNAIQGLLKDAEALQRTLATVKAQFDTLGQGEQFAGARSNILQISKDTGIAADEVARVFFQFKGAFSDTDLALQNTAAAMKLVQVTGLETAEAIDALTAISKTFGTSIEEVGDVSIGLEERFGVLSKETVSFLGDTAAVAKEAGLSLQDTAAIGAALQQSSGRSGATNAEAINRILPSLQQQKTAILDIYKLTPALAGSFDKILGAFSESKSGAVLEQIIRDFDKMDKSQQGQLIHAIGGRREAQALIPILEQHARLTEEFDKNLQDGNRDGGKLNSRFTDLGETVQQTNQRLSATFKELGQAIFNSGIGDIMVQAADGIGVVVQGISKLIGLFGELNNATKIGGFDEGILAPLAQMAVLAVLATKAFNLLATSRVGNLFVTKQSAGAEALDAEAKIVNTGATEKLTGAVAGETVSKQGLTVVSREAAAAEATSARGGALGRFFGAGGAFRGAFTQNSLFAGGGGFSASNTGAATGGGAAVGALAVAGALVVNDKYQQQKSSIEKQAQGFIDSLKKATEEDLQNIADSRSSAMEKISIQFFGQELPEILAAKELNIRSSEKAVKDLSALTPEQTTDFVTKINDTNLNTLGQYFNQSPDLISYARNKLGADADKNSATLKIDPNSIDRKKLEEEIPKLKERAAAGDENATNVVNFLDDTLNTQANLQALASEVQTQVEAGNKQAAIDLAGGLSKFASINAKTAATQRDAGLISTQQYIGVLKSSIETLKQQEAAGGDAFDDTDAANLGEAQKALQSEYDKRAKSMLDNSNALLSLAGNQHVTTSGGRALTTVKAAEYQNLLNYVNNPDLTQETKLAQIPALVSAAQAAFQESLNAIADPIRRAEAAKKGFTIPPELQRLLLTQRLQGDTEFQATTLDIANKLGTSQDAFIQEVIDAIQRGDSDLGQAAADAIGTRIEALEKLADATDDRHSGKYRAQIADLKRLQADALSHLEGSTVDSFDTGGIDAAAAQQIEQAAADEAKKQALNAISLAASLRLGDPVAQAQAQLDTAYLSLQQAIASGAPQSEITAAQTSVNQARFAIQGALDNIDRANANWASVFAAGDPVKAARAEKSKALVDLAIASRNGDQAGIISAQQAIAQADQSIEDALEGERQALYALDASRQRDPYKAAVIRLRAAQDALQSAKGAAAIAQATQAVEQAQKDIAEIISDSLAAQANLAISVANAAGDSVLAAKLGLAEAKRLLAKAQQEGAGAAEIAQLQANVVSQAASARDAELNTQERHIQFLLDMGNITTAQAISMLEALRQIPDLTQQQLEDIQLKIKSLQNTLSGDFQFNLPTNLDLPTAYEARRTVQSGGTSNYTDNRVVNTQIVLPDGMSSADVIQAVTDALNPGTMAANVNKKYPG